MIKTLITPARNSARRAREIAQSICQNGKCNYCVYQKAISITGCIVETLPDNSGSGIRIGINNHFALWLQFVPRQCTCSWHSKKDTHENQ